MTERRLYIGSLGPFFYADTDTYPTPQDAGDQGFGDGVLMNTVVTDGAILAASFKLWDTDATHTLELKWNEDDSANRILNFLVAGGNRSLTLNENFTIGGGYDVTITALGQANTLTLNESLTIGNGNSGTITFGNASDVLTINETLTLAGASGKTLTLTENLTIGDGTDITITGVTQANTLTLNESLTLGDGYDGTITFSAASKIVTVAGSCTLNDWFDQAVKAASNVSFGTIGCGTVTSSGNLIVADAGNIGSTTTPTTIAIGSNGNVGLGAAADPNFILDIVAEFGIRGTTTKTDGSCTAFAGIAIVSNTGDNRGVYGRGVNAGAGNAYHFLSGDLDSCSGGAWNDSSHSSRKELIRDLDEDEIKTKYLILDSLHMRAFRHKGEIPIVGFSDTETEIDVLGNEIPKPIMGNPKKAPERLGLIADDPDLPDFLATLDKTGLSGGRLANYALLCIKHQKKIMEGLTQRVEAMENVLGAL